MTNENNFDYYERTDQILENLITITYFDKNYSEYLCSQIANKFASIDSLSLSLQKHLKQELKGMRRNKKWDKARYRRILTEYESLIEKGIIGKEAKFIIGKSHGLGGNNLLKKVEGILSEARKIKDW